MLTRRIALAPLVVLALAGCTDDPPVEETPTVELSAAPVETTAPTPSAVPSSTPTDSPTASPTPSPTPSPSPTVDTSPGSLANPLAIGDALELGSWTVVVEDYTGQATEEVVEANSVNPDPENGRYALARLVVTNTGDEPAEPGFDLTVVVVATDGTEYPDTGCAALPEDSLTLAPEVEPGDEATGTFCFDLPSEDLPDAVLSVEETLAMEGPRLHVNLS